MKVIFLHPERKCNTDCLMLPISETMWAAFSFIVLKSKNEDFFSFRPHCRHSVLPALEGMKTTICLHFSVLFILLWIQWLVCSQAFRRHKSHTAHPATASPYQARSGTSGGAGSNIKLPGSLSTTVTSRALQ